MVQVTFNHIDFFSLRPKFENRLKFDLHILNNVTLKMRKYTYNGDQLSNFDLTLEKMGRFSLK